jgi:hypothetical protein
VSLFNWCQLVYMFTKGVYIRHPLVGYVYLLVIISARYTKPANPVQVIKKIPSKV